MATIWQRPPGSPGKRRWVATIRRRGYKPISRSFLRKESAEKWARSEESKMDAKTYQDPRPAETLTFAEAVDWYRETVLPGLRDRTGVEFRRLKRLERSSLAQLAVARIRPADVAAYLKERAAEIESSPRKRTGVEYEKGRMRSDTLRLEAARISSIFRALRDIQGLPVTSPVTPTVRPLPGRGHRLEIGRAEVEALLAAADPDLRMAMEFQIETALRPGELVDMRWPHVDLESLTLEIPVAKTEPRVIDLPPRAVEILRSLKRQKRKRDGDQVWPWSREDAYSARVREAVRKAGLRNVHAHTLRHEAITRLFEDGFDITEAAAISGHKTWSMLQKYTRLRSRHMRRRLDEIRGNVENSETKTQGR